GVGAPVDASAAAATAVATATATALRPRRRRHPSALDPPFARRPRCIARLLRLPRFGGVHGAVYPSGDGRDPGSPWQVVPVAAALLTHFVRGSGRHGDHFRGENGGSVLLTVRQIPSRP